MDEVMHVCAGSIESSTIGNLPIASRFRWLTSKRRTIVTTKHRNTLSKLFQQLVTRDEE